MTIKVGINGMGRIGRMVIRAIIESQNKNIQIKHINNRSNSEASCALIKYDSIHGKFNAELGYDENHLIINKNKITFSQESKIENINWKKFDVDYVFECTGKFNSKEKLLSHIKNGAKKVYGIEGKKELVEKGLENMQKYKIPENKYSFVVGDIFEEIKKIPLNEIDIVFCFGIFYHVSNHMELLTRVKKLNPKYLILDTEINKSKFFLTKG